MVIFYYSSLLISIINPKLRSSNNCLLPNKWSEQKHKKWIVLFQRVKRTNADKTSWENSVEISGLMTTRAWSPTTIAATRARSPTTTVVPARLRGPKSQATLFQTSYETHHHFPIARQNSPNHPPPLVPTNRTRIIQFQPWNNAIRMIHMITRHLLDHHTSFKIVFANSALSQLGTQQPVIHRHAWEILNDPRGRGRGAIGCSRPISGSSA